jgi:hypothetical protein
LPGTEPRIELLLVFPSTHPTGPVGPLDDRVPFVGWCEGIRLEEQRRWVRNVSILWGFPEKVVVRIGSEDPSNSSHIRVSKRTFEAGEEGTQSLTFFQTNLSNTGDLIGRRLPVLERLGLGSLEPAEV